VLGEVEHAAVARDLHVERRVVVEAVLPIDREAEEVDVELARLGLVEEAGGWGSSVAFAPCISS